MNVMTKVEQQKALMKKKNKKGFTLVELIVVIAIIAILAALLIPMVSKYIRQATDATGNANARAIYTAGAAMGAELIAEGKSIDTTSWAYKTTSGSALSDYLSTKMSGTGAVTLDSDGAVLEAEWKNGSKTYTYPKK